jgi:hypothetical protein
VALDGARSLAQVHIGGARWLAAGTLMARIGDHLTRETMLMCAARAALGVAMVTVSTRSLRPAMGTGGNPPGPSIKRPTNLCAKLFRPPFRNAGMIAGIEKEARPAPTSGSVLSLECAFMRRRRKEVRYVAFD